MAESARTCIARPAASTTQMYMRVLLGLAMLCCARTMVMEDFNAAATEAPMLPKSFDKLKLFKRVTPRCTAKLVH